MAGCPLVLTPAKIVVRFGDPVSINCSTSVAVPVQMGWEVTSGDISKNNISVTWSLEKVEDWSIKSACFITYEDNDMEQQCYVELDITLYSKYKSIDYTLSSVFILRGSNDVHCL